MALNWQWSDKLGSVEYNDGSTSTLYKGNAHMIAVNHLPDNYYTLAWFTADRDHFKNLLGLTKGYGNDFKLFNIKVIRLDVNRKETAQIVADLAKSKTPIIIDLYEGGAAV